MTTTFTELSQVFPGGSQSKRFSGALRRTLRCPEAKLLLDSMGVTSKDIGIHSLRKGSASLALNGLAGGGVSVTSVLLRGEWSLGNVHKRYWKSQDAGDQLIGRIVAGLDVASTAFADLPPHLDMRTRPAARLAHMAVSAAFPSILRHHSSVEPVLRQCLASVLHHRSSLLDRLPATVRSTLQANRVFADARALERLHDKLVLVSFDSPTMRCTGLPPHVILLRRLDQLREQSQSDTATLAHSVADQVGERLETLGVTGQGVTASGLQAALDLQRRSIMAQMASMLVAHAHPAASGNADDPDTVPAPVQQSHYSWPTDDPSAPSAHRFPYEYCLPLLSVEDGWVAWHVPSSAVPALSTVRPREIADKKTRRNFAAWRLVMKHVDQLAARHAPDRWDHFRSLSLLSGERQPLLRSLFCQVILPNLQEVRDDYAEQPPPGTKRKRKQQRAVTTVAKLLRKRLRQSNE
jgi:hypothetical protein